ncbi:MAG: T9SS type A sorting domain-containing protein [Candidatus Latescibacteria bacterium]|nr:T9SS type A sorting domain-containing protein [Candidatus Latescibacterota bacterium]
MGRRKKEEGRSVGNFSVCDAAQWTHVVVREVDSGKERVTYEVNLNGDVSAVSQLAASLDANRPNPFNPATTIRYSLKKAVDVELAIYNLLGQEVRLLVRQFQPAGSYTVTWDGRDAAGRQVSTGIYLYRLLAGADVVTRKMMLAK